MVLFFFLPELQFCCSGESLLSPLPFHVFLPPPLFPWPRFGTEDRNKGGGGKKKEGEGETVLSFLRSPFPLNKNQRAGGIKSGGRPPSRQTNRDRTRGEEKRISSDPPRKRKKGALFAPPSFYLLS